MTDPLSSVNPGSSLIIVQISRSLKACICGFINSLKYRKTFLVFTAAVFPEPGLSNPGTINFYRRLSRNEMSSLFRIEQIFSL